MLRHVSTEILQRYNKVLRGFLFTDTVFYNVNVTWSSADSALCGSKGDEQCNQQTDAVIEFTSDVCS
jgi:hypothetical protein